MAKKQSGKPKQAEVVTLKNDFKYAFGGIDVVHFHSYLEPISIPYIL
jgi:hypothetical protein